MEMRAGRPAGVADEADDLAALDLCPGVDTRGKRREVAVDRRQILRVLDADPVSVSGVGRGTDDRSARRRQDRRAGWRDQIDPVVHQELGAAAASALAGGGCQAERNAARCRRVDGGANGAEPARCAEAVPWLLEWIGANAEARP